MRTLPHALQAPSWSGHPRLVHGFTTRLGADGHTLDLGKGADETTWARAATVVGGGGLGVARMSQVHGATVLQAHGPGLVGEADAMWTQVPGLLLAVRTADCVPILLLGEGAVAVVHAGWRGVAAGVVAAAMEAFPEARPRALVGPCISVAHYEVGEEVVEGIVAAGVPAQAFVRRPTGAPRPLVDVGAAAMHQLRACDVVDVERMALCSFADLRLHSHRRDRRASGRMAGLIGRRR
jgi:YfiH family protein